jgi:caffeoyl-CoA O-methyltransferase
MKFKNMKRFMKPGTVLCLLFTAMMIPGQVKAQALQENPALDQRVEKFLSDRSGQWHDMNVPTCDGILLHQLILKGNYKSALEIGTSTGYSGIYMAWALSKTGGKLITIEIDEGRYRNALENFRQAGLSEYIDARLADAHSLVRELKGPFDFVFSDADKYWYKNYFNDVDPKLVVGGCYTTHNIREGNDGYRGGSGNQAYLEYVRSLKNYESKLNTGGGGLLISYKTAE